MVRRDVLGSIQTIVAWIAALFILVIILAAFSPAINETAKSLFSKIKFWEEKTKEKPGVTKAGFDEFNKAIRDNTRRTDSSLTVDEVNILFANMAFLQEVAPGEKLYKSTDGTKPVYMIFGIDETLRIVNPNSIKDDNEYKYTFTEYKALFNLEGEASIAYNYDDTFKTMKIDTPWFDFRLDPPLSYKTNTEYKGIKLPDNLKKSLESAK